MNNEGEVFTEPDSVSLMANIKDDYPLEPRARDWAIWLQSCHPFSAIFTPPPFLPL